MKNIWRMAARVAASGGLALGFLAPVTAVTTAAAATPASAVIWHPTAVEY